MTAKEAILTLNANAVIACERAGFSSATVKMIEDALDTIEDALKAQEPIKPREEETKLSKMYGKNIFRNYYCGQCNHPLDHIIWRDKYCPECGRKVLWND